MPRVMAGVLTALIGLAALLPSARRTVEATIDGVRPAIERVVAAPVDAIESALQSAALWLRVTCLPETIR